MKEHKINEINKKLIEETFYVSLIFFKSLVIKFHF